MRRQILTVGVMFALAIASAGASADTVVTVDNKSGQPISAKKGTEPAQGIMPGLTAFNLTTGQVLVIMAARTQLKLCEHQSQAGNNHIRLDVQDLRGQPACGASRGF